MAEAADLFAVITFRTGPGRSDFTFYRGGAGEWFDPALLIESVWEDAAAQDAWVEMWRYTAERYRGNPIVAGYDLMCEPNPAGLLEIYEPEAFYETYRGTLRDWNQFYPRLVAAVRAVDPDTPVLVGAMGWSGVRWLPYLEPVDMPRIVYMVHQYEPQTQYTHQEPPAEHAYPSVFDLNWDGEPDQFDRAWLETYLSIVVDFKAETGAPVSVNEFGVARWAPGAAAFMADSMAVFEAHGMNHALWVFSPAWPPYREEVNALDFLLGPDPYQHTPDKSSELVEAIRTAWRRNSIFPSGTVE